LYHREIIMFEFTTPKGKRITAGYGRTEDAEAREAREVRATLRSLREANDRERLHADSRLRRWRFNLQRMIDVE